MYVFKTFTRTYLTLNVSTVEQMHNISYRVKSVGNLEFKKG